MAVQWVVVRFGLELKRKVLGWRTQLASCQHRQCFRDIKKNRDLKSWIIPAGKKKIFLSHLFFKTNIIFKFFSLPTKELAKGLFQDQTNRGKPLAFFMNAMGNSWGSEKYSCRFANNFLCLCKQCHILWTPFPLQKGKLCFANKWAAEQCTQPAHSFWVRPGSSESKWIGYLFAGELG